MRVITTARGPRWYLGQESSELGQLSFAGSQLHAIRQQLLAIDAMMRRTPAVARAVGADVVAAWQRYSDLVSEYQRFRALLGLSIEPGLSGLGQLGVGTIVALVALIVTLAGLVGYLYNRARSAEAAEQMRIAQSQQLIMQATTLRQQAAQRRAQSTVAQQSGDVTAARQLAAEAASLEQQASGAEQAAGGMGVQDFSSWVQQNWQLVALAVGAIVVAPAIVDRFA